jgi:hypothetical protein
LKIEGSQYPPPPRPPKPPPPPPKKEILQMALIGFREQRRKIEGKIAEIEAELRGNRLTGQSKTTSQPMKRALSAASRKRIIMAARKRWAAVRKKQAATS